MLIETFYQWRVDPENKSILGDEESEENFDIYYQTQLLRNVLSSSLSDLAYQIYQLQVCVDGILEEIYE